MQTVWDYNKFISTKKCASYHTNRRSRRYLLQAWVIHARLPLYQRCLTTCNSMYCCS